MGRTHSRLSSRFSLKMICAGWVAISLSQPALAAAATSHLATLGHGREVFAFQNGDGSWGLEVKGTGLASAAQAEPCQLEIWQAEGYATAMAAGYRRIAPDGDGFRGTAVVGLDSGVRFEFDDKWTARGDVLRLARSVKVVGNEARTGARGFLSSITLRVAEKTTWPEVEWFAPGMIYGGFDHLTVHAIGGSAYYQPGAYTVRIREDRLPAPMLLGCFRDGSTLAVLDAAPSGATTAEEGQSVEPGTVIDPRLRFGSVGGQERDSGVSLGYWFPGTEGEETYQGNTYPGGQLHQWRRRFHPIRDGLRQQYEVAFRFGRSDGFPAGFRDAWRWAWQTLNPQVNPQDIDAARRSIVDVLAANVIQAGDRAGIPNALPSVPGVAENPDPKTVMGFTGKALESAELMLAESLADNSERGTRLRQLGQKIIASFLRLNMAPPEGEGFVISSEEATTARGHRQIREVYLRSFGDGMKALLRAYERERKHGHDHPEWLAWARQFADWLLTQQQPRGGFPRAWLPPSGEVVSDSPNSSFNAVPLLVLLNRVTGEKKYLEAAIRAADFCWANGQDRGRFVGGTIDNPDVLDKEAGTLSLEAYLSLYGATRDPKWLDRAKAAADYAETWIYAWNVPMPDDADDAALHWKRGVPTVGLQLIATGHSLVDAYMAFDVGEYAKLYKETGDAHYLDVARILLHNTKAMVALPGRTYDLKSPGWQQEHYSLAPRRGVGLHRLWLPWVATSQLNGIVELMELDPDLYRRLCENR